MMITPTKLGLISDPPALVLIYKIQTDDDENPRRRKRKIPLRNFTGSTNVIEYIQTDVRARHSRYLEEVPTSVIQKLLRIIQLAQKGYSIEAAVSKSEAELDSISTATKNKNPENDAEFDELWGKNRHRSLKSSWSDVSDPGHDRSNPSDHEQKPSSPDPESRYNRYLLEEKEHETNSEEDDLDVKSVSFSINLKDNPTETELSTSVKNVELPETDRNKDELAESELSEPNQQKKEKSESDSDESSGDSESEDAGGADSAVKFTDVLSSIFQPPKSRLAQLKSLRPVSAAGASATTGQSSDNPPAKINIRQLVRKPNNNLLLSKSISQEKAPVAFKQGVNVGEYNLTNKPEVAKKESETESEPQLRSPFNTNTSDNPMPPGPAAAVRFAAGARIMNSQSIDSNNDENDSDNSEESKPVDAFDSSAAGAGDENDGVKSTDAVKFLNQGDNQAESDDDKPFFSKSKQQGEIIKSGAEPAKLQFDTYQAHDYNDDDDEFW